jgi:hypothetical protein
MGSRFDVNSLPGMTVFSYARLVTRRSPLLLDYPDEEFSATERKDGDTYYHLAQLGVPTDYVNGSMYLNLGLVAPSPHYSDIDAWPVVTMLQVGMEAMRIPQLDRCTRGVGQLVGAVANIGAPGLVEYIKRATFTWDGVTQGITETSEEKTAGMIMGIMLMGIRETADGYEVVPLSNKATSASIEQSTTPQAIGVDQVVKDYLNNCNRFDGFGWDTISSSISDEGVLEELADASSLDQMIGLKKATTLDTRSWTEISPGQWRVSGVLETRRADSSSTSFTGGWVKWDCSTWALNQYSRVPIGFASRQD